jgi:TetR/AcrR family transcriptional regulator, regulator of cefoperazone and chloramphenicol sensitivity
MTAADDLTARARIRDAALRQFAEQGFERSTIRGIAATAGVSPGLVRHHFGSKEALRDAVDEHVLS